MDEITTVAWKDEGPGGPVWIGPHQVVRSSDNTEVWFTRPQAEALAYSLGAEFKEE